MNCSFFPSEDKSDRLLDIANHSINEGTENLSSDEQVKKSCQAISHKLMTSTHDKYYKAAKNRKRKMEIPTDNYIAERAYSSYSSEGRIIKVDLNFYLNL